MGGVTVHVSSVAGSSSRAEFYRVGDIVIYVPNGRAEVVGVVHGSGCGGNYVSVRFWSAALKSLHASSSSISPQNLVRIGRIE